MSRRKRFTRNLGRRLPQPLPVRTTVEWVRFEHEVEPYGLFSYAREAAEALGGTAAREIDSLLGWFGSRLGAPELRERARFWFKAEATEHVARGRRLAELVRAAGIPIAERRTRRVPGKVRFQDDDQVAVLTYRDAPRSRRGDGGDLD